MKPKKNNSKVGAIQWYEQIWFWLLYHKCCYTFIGQWLVNHKSSQAIEPCLSSFLTQIYRKHLIMNLGWLETGDQSCCLLLAIGEKCRFKAFLYWLQFSDLLLYIVYQYLHVELHQPITVCTTRLFCMHYGCIFVQSKWSFCCYIFNI